MIESFYMEEGDKHFREWIDVKEDIHFNNVSHTINEGEIWWCAVGENVGIEINGKSDAFARLYRFSAYCARLICIIIY